MKLVVATHNEGKIREFKALFAERCIDVVSLASYPELDEVEETGTTFEENARLKAETIAAQLNLPVLADDSGLVVPYLNGEPGIYSARYAGEPKDDAANITKLLEKLATATGEERAAYFVACLVLAYPGKPSYVVEGRAYGEIATSPRGVGGFGYDPVFYSPIEGLTFAELPAGRKNQISHRANALKAFFTELPEWLEGAK